jgi:hypothetical protein
VLELDETATAGSVAFDESEWPDFDVSVAGLGEHPGEGLFPQVEYRYQFRVVAYPADLNL